MEISVYGHYGIALLMFPATTDDHLEYEKNGIIEALTPFMQKGKIKIFSVGSCNEESWLNTKKAPQEKSMRQFQYNNYVVEELMPFIFNDCSGPIPIITCGAALGAYHAANTYFRRPDIFYGSIALSGTFNIEHLTHGYFDDNCYFNSPVHYLPNLNDNYWLSFLLSRHHLYIMSGSGDSEFPDNSRHLSNILSSKGITHETEIWSNEWHHDWRTWRAMLEFILENKI